MILHLEDHAAGMTWRHGGHAVSRAEVLDFARKFAMPIEDAGDGAPLRASGCHTLAIFQKLQIAMGLANGSAGAMLAALGLDEVRWLAPVHSGDVLSAEMEVLDTIPSRSKPDRGILKARYTLSNQHGGAVLSLVSSIMLLRRPAG